MGFLSGLFGGGSSKPPKPPDPAIQITQESAANRPNVISPYGSQTWTTGPKQVIGTDSSGKPIYGNSSTLNTSLAPGQQQILDKRTAVANTMLDQGASQLAGGAPGYGAHQDPFDINKSGSAAGEAFFKNQMDLLNPEFAKADNRFAQDLANQGLPIGSEAYKEAMRQHEMNKNFALTNAGRTATQIGADLATTERGVNDQERGMDFGQDYAKRNQYFDELGQFTNQPFQGPPDVIGGPIDVGGAYDAQSAAQRDAYNAQTGSRNSLLGGLFGLGSAYLGTLSDERAKEGIEHVGELDSGENLYSFRYKGNPDRHVGVMAQEVETTQPDAVVTGPDGLKRVNYRKVIARAIGA